MTDIRRLQAEDAAAFRALRLEALEDSADAFGASWANEITRPLEFFAARLAEGIVCGAFADGELVGIAGLALAPEREKTRHAATIWGVYVTERHRGKKVASGLMRELLADLPPWVEQAKLTVTAHNKAARALYAGLGFEEYGVEKNALKLDKRYYDEVLMVKFVGRGA
jgi:ribosomal protein S18 acetylase RimI-like enzyme